MNFAPFQGVPSTTPFFLPGWALRSAQVRSPAYSHSRRSCYTDSPQGWREALKNRKGGASREGSSGRRQPPAEGGATKTVNEILQAKSDKLLSISPRASVLEALKLMAEEEVGALLVLDGDKLAGIFSERDYARKVVL